MASPGEGRSVQTIVEGQEAEAVCECMCCYDEVLPRRSLGPIESFTAISKLFNHRLGFHSWAAIGGFRALATPPPIKKLIDAVPSPNTKYPNEADFLAQRSSEMGGTSPHSTPVPRHREQQ